MSEVGRSSEVGRTSAGLSSLAANGAHSQGPRPRADETGHAPLHFYKPPNFYKPPSLPERLESRAGSRQMSRTLSGRR
jgi:hypothetical protein